jgi:neutral ceramidase
VGAARASGDVNPRWLRTGTNAIASRSGQEIHGFEEIGEDIEAPLRNKEVEPVAYDPELGRELANYMESLGVVLGEEIIRVMSQKDGLQDDPVVWGAQSTLTCPGRTRLDNTREGVAGQYEPGDDVVIRLGVLGIGNTALVTTNGEVYTPIGQRVKAESPLANTMYVTLANGRALSGYIPDDASFGHLTFQVLGSRLLPGCAEEGIVDGLTGLVAAYLAH